MSARHDEAVAAIVDWYYGTLTRHYGDQDRVVVCKPEAPHPPSNHLLWSLHIIVYDQHRKTDFTLTVTVQFYRDHAVVSRYGAGVELPYADPRFQQLAVERTVAYVAELRAALLGGTGT